MKAAFALALLALATPALADTDGDSANAIRASIYSTVVTNSAAQLRSSAPRMATPAPLRRERSRS